MRINRKLLSVIICLIVIITSINAKGCNENTGIVVGNSSSSADILFTPYNLRTTIVLPTQISLSWIDNSTNETGFRIERSLTRNTKYSLLTTVATNIAYYEDRNVTPGVDYYYRVCGFNDTQYSAYSAEVLCNTATQNYILDLETPTALTYTIVPPPMLMPPQDGEDTPPDIPPSLNISWVDNSNNENGFILEFQLPGNPQWQTYATVGPNTTSYSRLVNAQNYFYLRIRAFNYAGYSPPSNIIEVFIPSQGAPVAPDSLIIQNVITNSNNNIFEIWLTLAWDDNSDNEAGFIIETEVSSNWTQFTTVGNNIASFTFDVFANPVFNYRIRAFNGNGYSAPSNSTSIWLPDYVRAPRPRDPR